MADETRNIVVENTTRNADSIEVGTLSKGGYNRTLKLYRDLSTEDGKKNLVAELKQINTLLAADFPTPEELSRKGV